MIKLYTSIILTIVVGLASAGECPQGSTRTVAEDGTVRVVRASGLVTTTTPDRRVTYTFEPVDQAHRDYVLMNCNMTTPSPVRTNRTYVITTPTGAVTGYITTK